MSKRFNGELPFAVAYSAPSYTELQHDTDNASVSLHTDVTLMMRIDKMRMTQQVRDIVMARFQEVPSQIRSEVQEQIDKLSDWDRDKSNPSRYMQTLSDRKDYIANLMRKVDEEAKSLKDKAEEAKVTSFRDGLLKLFDTL